jgi:lysosomal alpha-mannosidase
LKHNFGDCGIPKVAWQIDPFGHSREHANIVTQMGYEGLFFAREHYKEHEIRKQNKTLEMNWLCSNDLNSILFTGVFYNHYGPPPGFCWDIFCGDEPIQDNPSLENNNAEKRIKQFLDYVLFDQLPTQPHNHVMILMGSDFQYSNADMWFVSLDKLIKGANKHTPQTNVTLAYSTPTCYLKAVQALNLPLTQKTEDFFPYAMPTGHSYWTGYFTSKPDIKGNVRKGSAFLQLIRQFNALSHSFAPTEDNNMEELLERAQALSQHHDAITSVSMGWMIL